MQVTYNFIPFNSIQEILMNSVAPSVAIKQLLGNILMCIPLGFFIPLLSKTYKFYVVTLIGLGFSIAIEIIQLAENLFINYRYRVVDIDDIMLNVFGVILGYISFVVCRIIWKKTLGTWKKLKETAIN